MSDEDAGWRSRLNIAVNYTSSGSEDEFDENDVVTRASQRRHDSSGYLLADSGDGAPVDMLGTTPPRVRIRNKEKRRNNMDTDVSLNKMLRASRRNTVDTAACLDTHIIQEHSERPKLREKRASLKNIRSRERDMKLDIGQAREHRADSLPSPTCYLPDYLKPQVTPMVDSCSRFMSLTSRLKCRGEPLQSPPLERAEEESLPPGRVSFHKTFSMLIKMGNTDKNCRRALSVEEQVWQNQRKDLIWLELRARLAGRTMQQQDELLCQQRDTIPTVIADIINYRFVNTTSCSIRSCQLTAKQVSEGYHSSDAAPTLRNGVEHLGTITENNKDAATEDEERYHIFGCLCLDCEACSDAVGKALKEVGILLDSFYTAETLYPSSKAMAAKHPLIATQLFNNRLKAMCLWYNIAYHLRFKVLGIRKLMKLLQWKAYNRQRSYQRVTTETDQGSSNLQHTPLVQFNLQNSKNGSNHSTSSDSSSGENRQMTSKDETDNSVPTVKLVLDDEKDSDTKIDPERIYPKDGTVDTTGSNESGYTSDIPNCGSFKEYLEGCKTYSVYDLGPMSDILKLRLLGNCEVSPYRNYISDILKTQGLRKALRFIDKIRKYILTRAYMTFEKYNSSQQSQYRENDPAEVFDDTNPQDDDQTERCKYEDAKNAFELRRYGCWSSETLQMRLPSYRSTFLLLSTICMEVVHDYLTMRLETQPEKPSCLTIKQLMHELKEGLDIATEQRAAFVRNIDTALDGYDTSGEARNMFVRVVQLFDSTIEKVLTRYLSYLNTMSEVEHMSRSLLEREWGFAARLARRTRCAAVLAPHSFADIMCNQLNGTTKRFTDKFRVLMESEAQIHSCTDSEVEGTKRNWVYSLCRSAQAIYVCERELTTQTAQFSRLLALRLKKNTGTRAACARIFDALMTARDCIVHHIDLTIQKTEGAPWEEDCGSDIQSILVRVREVLLQGYKLGFDFHKELHRFVQEAPCERNRCGGGGQRRPSSINVPARNARPKLTRSDSIGGEGYVNNVFQDMSTASVEYGVPEMCFEDEDSFNPVSIASAVCEARQEVFEERIEDQKASGDAEWEEKAARAIIDFAKSWMRFVTERCDRGRGLRPRWASHGLEFLMLACDPCNTKHLTEAEFEELKGCMDNCISHVVGSRSPGGATPPAAAVATPPPQRRRHGSFNPHPLAQMPSKQSRTEQVPTPPTPPTEPNPVRAFHVDEESLHSRRAEAAARRLDAARDELLLQRRAVGRVVETTGRITSEPKLRQVTFQWQRGLKIGAGNFGKVYTVVNIDSGQLLAMKEISIGPGDRRALQKAANELKVLEGIIHPHLVRYYGCEVHREEMLIFMELCVEGSLEALLAESGALPEPQIRRYTKQLVSAVQELHNRQIAHRDIKTGNIFLTNERHCLKLGDFGCAVKIRANTTAAGELQGYVGTQAYMAPEVFSNSTGHGRAADIWSLGCVITEMASGKRPFSEYDNNFQIMFVVGSGGRPEIPDSLSEEGRSLCEKCLQHDPDERIRAADIAPHHFLKVGEEGCHCEPGYLITK